MHRMLYFGGMFAGGGMLIISVFVWFKLGIKKAFRDVLNYGSKGKWSAEQRMQNRTMPLRKTNSGRLVTDRDVKRSTKDIGSPGNGNNSNIEETVLLENYHGQILENYNKDNDCKTGNDFEIIEEINLIAGGR